MPAVETITDAEITMAAEIITVAEIIMAVDVPGTAEAENIGQVLMMATEWDIVTDLKQVSPLVLYLTAAAWQVRL